MTTSGTGRSPGSSPLTRGKRRVLSVWSVFQRLIPAHAGKTSCPFGVVSFPAAHPRSRGENGADAVANSVRLGSSPLTRGKRARARSRGQRVRLIPAHAGKTSRRSRSTRSTPAHPRSRGENGGRVAGLRGVRGSSPLTRGKPHGVPQRPVRRRLIPAHAGKTTRSCLA